MLFVSSGVGRAYKGKYKKRVSNSLHGKCQGDILDLIYSLTILGINTNIENAVYDRRSDITYIDYKNSIVLTKIRKDQAKNHTNYNNVLTVASEAFRICGYDKNCCSKCLYSTVNGNIVFNLTKLTHSKSMYSPSDTFTSYLRLLQNKYKEIHMTPHFALIFKPNLFTEIKIEASTIYSTKNNITFEYMVERLIDKVRTTKLYTGEVLTELFESYISPDNVEGIYPSLVIDYTELKDFPMCKSIEFMIHMSALYISPISFIL